MVRVGLLTLVMSFVGPTRGEGWMRLFSWPLMPTSPGVLPGQTSITRGSAANPVEASAMIARRKTQLIRFIMNILLEVGSYETTSDQAQLEIAGVVAALRCLLKRSVRE